MPRFTRHSRMLKTRSKMSALLVRVGGGAFFGNVRARDQTWWKRFNTFDGCGAGRRDI